MRVAKDNYETQAEDFDIVSFINDLQEKHDEVYWTHIFNQIYVYKPLGRKDHRELCKNEELTTEEKEDAVCQLCLFYPQVDFDNVSAGVVQKLFGIIMKNSFMDSAESRAGILNYYRQEMFDPQNQVSCLIHEAFPSLDIEEIDNWGVEKTARYLSKAEFKLVNFKGLQINTELMEAHNKPQEEEEAKEETKDIDREEAPVAEKPKKKKKKAGMSPEELRQMQAQFPEINWSGDTIMNEGMEGMKDGVDVLSPALRTFGD